MGRYRQTKFVYYWETQKIDFGSLEVVVKICYIIKRSVSNTKREYQELTDSEEVYPDIF